MRMYTTFPNPSKISAIHKWERMAIDFCKLEISKSGTPCQNLFLKYVIRL
jgi:hypothetical protein